MPREGAIILLDVLNVERDQCDRRGRYHLRRLIERFGIDAKLFEWSDEITADCPRKQARNLKDLCGARCPMLRRRWERARQLEGQLVLIVGEPGDRLREAAQI